jgi:glycosyltransferase involved in cell wall biosynthesis
LSDCYTKRTSGPQLITDGDDGLLVDEAEIARAIMRMLSDSALARRISVAGHRRVQDFAAESIARKNVAFLSGVPE